MTMAGMWLHILCKIIIGGLTFMKFVKRFFFIAMLLAGVAMLLTSCDDGGFGGSGTFGGSGGGGNIGGGGGNIGGGDGFVLNAQQRGHYEAFISTLTMLAAIDDVDEITVRTDLDSSNAAAVALGYQIEDRKGYASIPKGTNANALKRRFVPKKL